MLKVIDSLNHFVWGFPALVLILSVGIMLSVRTGWAQLRLFPAAIQSFLSSFRRTDNRNGVSPFRALCTALASTVGTGNLAGVGGAISIGGPGAIFWMWISALLGMVTKFAEATLSVCYRIKDADGNYVGGPMYIAQHGLGAKWRPVAAVYCFFGVVAAFGVGSATQVNAVLGGINGAITALGGNESTILNFAIGMTLSVFVLLVLLGGAKCIGGAAMFLVPFASVFYIVLCIGVLIINAQSIPMAFRSIICGAFCPKAVTGGMIGSAFQALRIGTSRGVFTNEAGMGTAGIAHGSADVRHPVQQGLMGIIEVFLDTIVICTMTGLVILCSGITVPYGQDLGIRITADAFTYVYGSWVNVPIAIALCCFAFATMIGWGLYGMRCAQYLFGTQVWKGFALLQAISVVLGAVISTGTVWSLAETANGLMAIPNLIILIFLTPELVQLVKDYQFLVGRKSAGGGTYEDFKKSEPMRLIADAQISSFGGEGSGGW